MLGVAKNISDRPYLDAMRSYQILLRSDWKRFLCRRKKNKQTNARKIYNSNVLSSALTALRLSLESDRLTIICILLIHKSCKIFLKSFRRQHIFCSQHYYATKITVD